MLENVAGSFLVSILEVLEVSLLRKRVISVFSPALHDITWITALCISL